MLSRVLLVGGVAAGGVLVSIAIRLSDPEQAGALGGVGILCLLIAAIASMFIFFDDDDSFIP